jgi:AraC-like DNA-binding protein
MKPPGKAEPHSDPIPAPEQERRRWPRHDQPGVGVESTSPALEPLRISTRHHAPEEQFAAWQAHAAPLVDVALPDGKWPKDGFRADQTVWNLGSMLVVQQDAPAHSFARSAAKLRASPIDHWYVAILRTGRTWTEVDGRVAENQPGRFELRSLGYPFSGRTTDSKALVLYLPRDLFFDAAAVVEASNNTVLSGNLTNLMIDYINGIEAKLHRLSTADLPGVVHTVRDMVIASLSSVMEHGSAGEQKSGLPLMERARQHIRKNLASPDLTPEALSRALGVSRTRLYQLFESSGGVLHYIRRRRLLAAHAALADPADERRIGEVAEAVGFSSAANFSRAFQHAFGYSPRDARNMAIKVVRHEAQRDKTHSFEDWLKKLGS